MVFIETDKFLGWKKSIGLFLAGQTITQLGSLLVQFAMIWYITLTTESGLMITLATVFGFAPQIIISLFSGVWADHYKRKHLIIIADSLVALSTFILALFFLLGYKGLWLLFLVMAIRSLGSGIQGPAVSSVIPQLVPKKYLIKVNGINGTLQSLMMLIAPAVSGLLYSIFQIEVIFFIDVLTAIIGIGALLSVKIPYFREDKKASTSVGFYSDLKQGIQYLLSKKLILYIMIVYGTFMFLFIPTASLSPLLVARVFGSNVWYLTAIELTFSLGAIAGGLIMSTWGGFKNRLNTIILAGVLFSLFSIFLCIAQNFLLFIIFMGIIGITMPLFNTPVTTLLQESIEPHMQGRVFGIMQTIGMGAMPLGMVVFGPIADYINIKYLILFAAICLLPLGGAFLWHIKHNTFKENKSN